MSERTTAYEANARAFGENGARIIDELAKQRDKARAEIDRLRAELENARRAVDEGCTAVVRLEAEIEEVGEEARIELEALREAGELMYVEAPGAWNNWREVAGEKTDPDVQLMEMEC